MSINRQSHVPLYIQIKEDLKKNIMSDLYSEGETIPSEKELMDSYQVGRATVREAINQLSSEGFVEKKQGIGTFVKGHSKSSAFEPFISLEYALKSYGMTTKNIVLEKKLISSNSFFREISKINSDELFILNRLRQADQQNVALEEFIFNKSFYDTAQNANFEKSIGSLIIKELQLDITKFTQEVIIEEPSKEVMSALNILASEKVLIMKRWLFINNQDTPYQYYKLTVPLRLTSFPFA